MHSTFMAAGLTFGPIIIVVLDSWRLAYFVQGALMAGHLLVWAALTWRAREPAQGPEDDDRYHAGAGWFRRGWFRAGRRGGRWTPTARPALIRSLISYPHAWLLGVVMLWLSASWTTVLTFLPTILETNRGISVSSGSVLFGFLYYILIPGALVGSWIFNHITNRRLMVLLPAVLNLLATVGAVLAGNEVLAALALTGMGIAWVFVPAMEILPFEFRNIRTREVSVIAGLVQTFGAVGFGAGPVIAGGAGPDVGFPGYGGAGRGRNDGPGGRGRGGFAGKVRRQVGVIALAATTHPRDRRANGAPAECCTPA